MDTQRIGRLLEGHGGELYGAGERGDQDIVHNFVGFAKRRDYSCRFFAALLTTCVYRALSKKRKNGNEDRKDERSPVPVHNPVYLAAGTRSERLRRLRKHHRHGAGYPLKRGFNPVSQASSFIDKNKHAAVGLFPGETKIPKNDQRELIHAACFLSDFCVRIRPKLKQNARRVSFAGTNTSHGRAPCTQVSN